jgi:CubicO group peptidase (beta-lactamase class C family)
VRRAALRDVASVLAATALAACGPAPPAAVVLDPVATPAAVSATPLAVDPPGALAGSAVNPSGPNAAAIYGLTAEGFPRADPSTWWQAQYLVDSHSRMDEIFPAHRVDKPAAPRPLRRAAAEPAIGYRVEGEERTLDGYLARHPTTGFLLVKDDTILVERYQYDRRDRQRFASWSMAKTVTAMLVGIAIDEGRIRSIDDRPSEYVPELAGTAYGATPIRHLLTMSSGVRFSEDYSGRDDVTRLATDTFRGVGPGGPAAVTALQRARRRARDALFVRVLRDPGARPRPPGGGGAPGRGVSLREDLAAHGRRGGCDLARRQDWTGVDLLLPQRRAARLRAARPAARQ